MNDSELFSPRVLLLTGSAPIGRCALAPRDHALGGPIRRSVTAWVSGTRYGVRASIEFSGRGAGSGRAAQRCDAAASAAGSASAVTGRDSR